ncbi:MAG: RNA methyltransferase [Clostridia bacterium]|nr:RNA methyltransferase [Clostridia bacterium]
MNIIKVGKENATYQEIVALKENRTKRFSSKKFFVEGVQNIKDAISNNWEIDAFIFESYDKLSNWAKGVLGYAKRTFELSPNLMSKLSDKEDTSELLAIVKMKEQDLNIKNLKNPLFVLIDRPSKKGNLGTILRSADALFVNQIFYCGHGVDIYDHNVITSSMGSFFKVPFKFISSNEEFENIMERIRKEYKDFQIVGTSLQGSKQIEECDFTKPTLLLVGNEANGLSKYLNEKADVLTKIEISENIDSLNVACATSIFLYEINRQRGKSRNANS